LSGINAPQKPVLFGGVGLLIAVLALVAVVVMLPLKQTDVELYTVDNHTGRVEHVTRTSKTSLTAEEAYQKAMAANYVKMRERYVYPSSRTITRRYRSTTAPGQR
jgi:type IV secretion system protein VirB8